MTSEEIKQAMLNFSPVICNDIKYKRITAYIYRVIENAHKGTYKTVMECELLDYNEHSVTIADAAKVELAEKEK